jgi:apolipoprotein N-acyltransferase
VFSLHPNWVQWYEYTGIGGGTLLIVLTNIFLYECILEIRKPAVERKLTKPLIALTTLVTFVVGYAFYFQNRAVTKATQTLEVVIVQPNINPYSKFTTDSMAAQIERLVALSRQQLNSNTRLLVWPETAMSAGDWQENTRSNPLYQPVFELLTQFPKLSLLSGIEMFVPYGAEKKTNSARSDGRGGYYDAMNAAMMANAVTNPQYYYKSKLVPGVETLPDFLLVLAPLFEQFGGTSGGYGKSATSAVLPTADGGGQIAPIICYESIYGEYVGTYVKKGANLLAIITNDGWWGNTPGHKQHLNMARLRAIETRKWIVRSANTGISAIINDRGEIVDTRPWDTMAALKFSVPLNEQSTVYVILGDFLYKLTLYLGILTLCWHLWHWLKQRLQKK